jgi:hypothetical protein
MRFRASRVIFYIFIAALAVVLVYLLRPAVTPEKDKPIGGQCLYDTYKGKAVITSIKMTPESRAQRDAGGGPRYPGYEIKFIFKTDKHIRQDWAQEALDREYLLMLKNSWYPGKEYIKKYGIKQGKEFNAALKVITRGTCTPIIFEFENIKRDDYFESK